MHPIVTPSPSEDRRVTPHRALMPAPPPEAPLSEPERALYDELSRTRRVLAQEAETEAEQRVPAYHVAPNAALRALARLRPADLDGLRLVRGFGPARAEAYGAALIGVVHRVGPSLGLHARTAAEVRALVHATEQERESP